MTPDDLGTLRLASSPRIHPGGRLVAFVLAHHDVDADRMRSSIWMHDGTGARRFTSGERDSSPRWSPDGSALAFLRSAGPGEPAQVAVMPATGGEPVVVSSISLGVESIEWSPDGSRIVATGVSWVEEWDGLSDEERSRRPRRIDRIPYRFDNLGWTHDRRRHLWLIDPSGGLDGECLTPGPFDERYPAWSPDGRHIAFVSDRSGLSVPPAAAGVWEVELDGGAVRRVAEDGKWTHCSYRPDGALHLIGSPGTRWPTDSGLHRVEENSLTNLTGHLDRGITSPMPSPPVEWNGDVAITGYEDSGRFGLIAVHPDGVVDHVLTGNRVVKGFDVGEAIVAVVSTSTRPGDLIRIDDGTETVLHEFEGPDGLLEPEHFRIPSGGTEIDAWVMLPEGDGSVPLLLNVHGGPSSQYDFGFFDEFQVYAGAGYGVVACNPRGSGGRGQAFLDEVVGDGWGTVDLEDIRAVVDAALDRFPRLDGSRMGIMGGSYGGFLTAWTIGHEQRWASAVVERALLSFTSFAGTSDIGKSFPKSFTGADYPDAWERWWEKSPLSLAHRIETPTLVIHSEQDFRCPIEQAEQLFTALLRNGAEASFLRFPGEGHELSRSGSPRHRRERFEAILDWHARHLLESGG